MTPLTPAERQAIGALVDLLVEDYLRTPPSNDAAPSEQASERVALPDMGRAA
jgi:hypothetical protein